ncbi:MAG: toxin-antitoxin system HicB family antitoxin [Methylobacter sp.]|nr:toxin-antitoxin system HicB family antitoxin [Methylobacter sp.]
MSLDYCVDTYADAEDLRREGAIRLKYLWMLVLKMALNPACSGKFVLRIPPEDHAAVTRAAITSGKSLNQWGVEVLKQAASQ